MLNNLNGSENADAVENIGDHSDFAMHAALPDSKLRRVLIQINILPW